MELMYFVLYPTISAEGPTMLETEISIYRLKLHKLIENDASFEEIYKASIALDELISKYYKYFDIISKRALGAQKKAI